MVVLAERDSRIVNKPLFRGNISANPVKIFVDIRGLFAI